MFQFKIFNLINFQFVNAALLATAICSLVPTKIEATSPPGTFARQLPLAKREAIQPVSKFSQNKNIQKSVNSQFSISSAKITNPNLLLADNPDSDSNARNKQESSTKLVKNLPLIFLLMFFVPLGIFYPLFLFYRMLLVKPDQSEESKNILDSDRPQELTDPARVITDSGLPLEVAAEAETEVKETELKVDTGIDINKATVSKLQIAFTPPASQLRRELGRVSSVTTVNPKEDLVDLMHRAVEVLIEQGHWTHVSYSSITLPLEKVKQEFDYISHQERNKFINKTPGFVDYNRNISSSQVYQENYSYVVVTLILCTSHHLPIFETINTKKQLVEELIKLSKMKKDSVIKFELLWNPQQEDIYISNEQILIEYGEMVRLL